MDQLIDFGQLRTSLDPPSSKEDLNRIQALANAERALQGGIASPEQDRIAGDVAAALGSSASAESAPVGGKSGQAAVLPHLRPQESGRS